MYELNGIDHEELNCSELSNVNGGAWAWIASLAVGLLIVEWESTKQAAIDAWKGEYNPPD